jgi:hypothetical protein
MCLELAVKNNCDSIAFPLLASGNHGFPKSKALQVAIGAFSEFLMEHEMQIYLVVFSKDSVKLSEKLVNNVACYIDENYVEDYEQEIYGGVNEERRRDRYQMRRIMEMQSDCMMAPCASEPCAKASTAFGVRSISQSKMGISSVCATPTKGAQRSVKRVAKSVRLLIMLFLFVYLGLKLMLFW